VETAAPGGTAKLTVGLVKATSNTRTVGLSTLIRGGPDRCTVNEQLPVEWTIGTNTASPAARAAGAGSVEEEALVAESRTTSVLEGTLLKYRSTARTVTSKPWFTSCGIGAPALPEREPGAAPSPRMRTWSLSKAPGSTPSAALAPAKAPVLATCRMVLCGRGSAVRSITESWAVPEDKAPAAGSAS
jgi:hypothetical protein